MENKKERDTINTLYMMLVVATIASFMPVISAMVLSLVLAVVALVAAYFYRAKDNEDGLLYNHMTYMIRTIWIGSSFIALAVIAATMWVYTQGDHTVIQNAINDIAAGGAAPSDEILMNVTIDYMNANKNLVLTSALLTIGPAMLYFVYRIANGFSRSWRGYRIANPKSWL